MSVKQKTVLSIDGGGIRGIIPAMILAKIESQTLDNIRELIQKSTDKTDEEKAALHAEVKDRVKIKDGKEFMPTAELFHLIAGASTGGILALALTRRDPNAPKQPLYTAEELANFYPADGKKIFGRSLWRRLPGVGHVLRGFRAKYSSGGITCVLKKRLGGTMLSDALTPVLIPSYEMVKREAWFFRSKRAKKQSDYDFRMQDVALATSAAPTYFPAHQMPVTTEENGQTVEYDGRFVDGGIYANHPAMCAYVEAEDMKGEDTLLVSLGTGEQMPFSKGKNARIRLCFR